MVDAPSNTGLRAPHAPIPETDASTLREGEKAGHTDLFTPWSIVEYSDSSCDIEDADGDPVANITAMSLKEGRAKRVALEMCNRVNAYEANEALIKELFEALTGLRGFMPPAGDDRVNAVLRLADAALAKAVQP